MQRSLVLESGDDAELLHQAKRVPLLPLLNDSSARNTVDGDSGNAKPLARRSNAQELPPMGTCSCPASDHVNIVSELVLHRSFGVRKSRKYAGKELLQRLAS